MGLPKTNISVSFIENDKRFKEAIDLFNSGKWYPAHDVFEELWHETNYPERITIQGFLQISVAQLHLEKGNTNGAAILYGEALGRIEKTVIPNFGLDLEKLCQCVKERLKLLHRNCNPDIHSVPFLFKKELRHS